MSQKQANQLGGGMPSQDQVLAGGGADMGALPPELAAVIDNLPPEALQAVLEAVQAEMAEGQAPAVDPSMGGGMPPGAGAEGDPLIAKTSAYKEGFIARARELDFTQKEAEDLYARTVNTIESATPSKEQAEKIAAHYEGFMKRAEELQIPAEVAYNLYVEQFAE